MPVTEQDYIVLFEFDKPADRDKLLNYEAGIWFWTITNTNAGVYDDQTPTPVFGYYEYQQPDFFNIKSLRVDDESYTQTESLADCRTTDSSFYYDEATTYLYIHFKDFEPPLAKEIFVGVATGYTYGNESDVYYGPLGDQYYEPRVKQIFNTKKSKDPLFFGLLKFQSGKINLINSDGHFDTWRALNLFGQPARLLLGNMGDSYADFTQIFGGFIEDDARGWDDFSVTVQDIRKGLSQPVATNLLTTTDYPDLNEDDIDNPKPVAYGQIFNAVAICLNSEEAPTPTNYTFLICDTEFNFVSSLDEARVDGVAKTPVSTDLINGTFTLSASDVGTDQDSVTIDFSMGIDNGVDIIKDLMANYDGTPYLTTFWDTTEVDEAETQSRDTSLYIDDNRKLSKAIESVAYDIDGIFFSLDNGKYTIRIYDPLRAPVKAIQTDEWMDKPVISNNGSEFLTSAIIGYRHDQDEDKRRQVEDLTFQTTAFDTYKRYNNKKFNTELVTEADALEKSNTILTFSSNVQDIITRTTKFQNSDLEPMDFVTCSPTSRFSEEDDPAVYEVLGVVKNYESYTIKLTLRYVRENNYYLFDSNDVYDFGENTLRRFS